MKSLYLYFMENTKYKLLFLIVSMILLQLSLFSQNKLFTSIEINTGVNSSVLFHEDNQNRQITEWFQGKLGYEIESVIGLSVTDRIKIKLGIKYFNTNYNHHIENIVWGANVIDGTTSNLKTVINAEYIGIPVSLNLLLLKKEKIEVEFSTGLGFFQGFNKKIKLFDSGELLSSEASGLVDITKNNFLTNVGLNINCPFIENKFLFFGRVNNSLLLKSNIHSAFIERKANVFLVSLNFGIIRKL